MISARFKSLFILPATVASALLCVIALVMAVTGGPDRLAWWGAAFAALPLPVIVVRLMRAPVPRASENAPLALLVSSGGAFLAAWELFIERIAGWPPFVVAVVALVLLLLYVFWYSRFGRITTSRLDVGSKLPAFTVTDLDGNEVSSETLAGRPAVLLFYRGNWCPLCMGQVAEMAARHEEFERLGITVALISPQGAQHTRQLAERHDVPFRFWIDNDLSAARSLDIALAHGVPLGAGGGYQPDTVMPTVVVTTAAGTIVYADQTDNYRVRPEPEIFLAILRRSGAITG